MIKSKNLFKFLVAIVVLSTVVSCKNTNKEVQEPEVVGMPKIQVSENGHYFQTEDKKPFFWLGDTGWLAFNKLDRAGIKKYFKDRKEKEYNVIQIMTIHSLGVANVFGDSALVAKDLSKPLITEGDDYDDVIAYDYWDHIDYALDVAKEEGLFLAMVPVWGSPISDGKVNIEQAKIYASFLAERFKDRDNIIWLVGGDTFGNKNTELWKAIGNILKTANPERLVTFHPRGRTDSSDDFHNENWLDFNMFQSGHRRYDQDDTERAYGQDNYKFTQVDFKLKPAKPTLDGEPSYEGIPQGLHDTLQPLWNDNDLRRYAYWSVFSGSAGFTYGHNAVMQMYGPTETKTGAYGNHKLWTDAVNDPGSKQMKYVKQLMLEHSYFERIPDVSLVANQGEKYDFKAATRTEDYAMIYVYNGKTISVNMGKIKGEEVEASWYNPKNGESTPIGAFKNEGIQDFTPTGEQVDGNDWVLILTSK